MKKIIGLFIFTLALNANAGVPERAMRIVLQTAKVSAKPVVSETDIMKFLRQAQSKARGEHMSPEVDIIAQKIPSFGTFGKTSYFKSSVTSQSEFAKSSSKRVDLIFDVKGIDARTKRRIRTLISDGNWTNIGHFDSRITALEDNADDLFIKIELIGIKSMDLNNIRGIRTIIDDVFKVATQSNSRPVLKPTLVRPVMVGVK